MMNGMATCTNQCDNNADGKVDPYEASICKNTVTDSLPDSTLVSKPPYPPTDPTTGPTPYPLVPDPIDSIPAYVMPKPSPAVQY
jgi:hypothetical protein